MSAFNTTGGATENSDTSFKITPTPGSITARLTSENDVNGSRQKLTVDLTLSHYIPETGIIKIQLPKWNPDSPLSVKSILTAGSTECTANTGFVKTNKIVCTFEENIDSSNTIDQLTVTGEFNSATYNIVFFVANFRNPPSLTTYSTIAITTSTSTSSERIDQATNVNLPITQIATLDASQFAITVANKEINVQTSYTFNIRIGLPLPMGSSIKLTFPSSVTPASSGLVVTGETNLNSAITSAYDSATRILTLTNLIITSSAYVDEGYYIQFKVNLVTNPSNTKTSDSFTYQSFDGNGNAIEKTTTGITITATPGKITPATVTPVDTKIRASTSYTFVFTVQTQVPVGGIVYIVFPTTINLLDQTSAACLSSGTNIDSTNGR